MRDFNFAVLVSVKENAPIATHLPFIIEEKEGEIHLLAHMSRANEQWKYFGEEVLVIFSEPHAYVSPSLYQKVENVPTWNYISVHAYGKISIIDQPDKQLGLLEKQMQSFDPGYLKQWAVISPEYKDALRKGIVAFEIIVTDLQGKEKLSQNKTEADRQNVKKFLEESDDALKQYLAKKMK